MAYWVGAVRSNILVLIKLLSSASWQKRVAVVSTIPLGRGIDWRSVAGSAFIVISRLFSKEDDLKVAPIPTFCDLLG